VLKIFYVNEVFFLQDNLLVSIENRGNKSHSRAVSKIKSGHMLEDVRNTRTCTWKTRNSNSSRIMKFGRGAVSKAGEGNDCLEKDEKMVNAKAHEHAFERKTCAKVEKRGVGNKILREREEGSCLKNKVLAETTHQRKHCLPRK